MSRTADRAAAYHARYRTALGAAAHQIEVAVLEELAAPQAGQRALDAGCGTGIFTAWLARILQVPFADGSVDFVISNRVIALFRTKTPSSRRCWLPLSTGPAVVG